MVYTNGIYEHGYWGEVMTTAAKVGGLAGLVIDAAVRDADLLERIGFRCFRGAWRFAARARITGRSAGSRSRC
jgi:regulator of RNase E activity RraA